MARISLRSYNREIEALTVNGQIDEATAHCKHILKAYPKYIDTYRLLGKAYMEGQRYSDAADILQRVLSSVPDDFIAHLGMSIIREDEGHLNEAIWHMERAFEAQPSNSAIQAELRRLYGRRDGFEPPKIRLTRGALARMYVKGELYQQAIGELRSALAEDPQRLDLQILLARAYAQTGQKVEAVESCTNVLRKLPNCLEANRIIAGILSETGRSEDAKGYIQRSQTLDPYLAHLSGLNSKPEKVPEMAVSIEKLVWKPGESFTGQPDQPEWVSALGVNIGNLMPGQESLPEWLSGVGEKPGSKKSEPGKEAGKIPITTQLPAWETSILEDVKATDFPIKPELPVSQPEKSSSSEGDLIPDWIKNADWVPSSGKVDEGTASFEFSKEGEVSKEEIEGLEGLTPAEVPDWLKSMAPEQDSEKAPTSPGEDLNQLPEVKPIAEEAQQTSEVPDWLQSLATQEKVESTQAEIPDWLAELQGIKPAEEEHPPVSPGAEVPEWLSELKEEAPAEVPPEEAVPVEAAAEAEVPDWLRGLQAEVPAETIIQEATPTEAIPEAEIPELLDKLKEEVPPEAAVVEAAAEAEPPSGLHEDKKEETPSETIPQEAAPVETIIEAQTTAEAAPFAEAQPPAFNLEDDEAAFAWLESLAVKQGAEEALLLKPEERLEAPPEWIKEIAQSEEAPIATLPPLEISPVSEPTSVEEAVELQPEITPAPEVSEWLPAFEEEKAAEISGETAAGPPFTTLPEWLQSLEVPEEIIIGGAPATEEAPSEALPAELPDWLLEMKDQETQVEAETPTVIETIEEKTEEPQVIEGLPSKEEKAAETPKWPVFLEEEPLILGDTKPIRVRAPLPPDTSMAPPAAIGVAQEAEPASLPDWLKSMAVEAPTAPVESTIESESTPSPEQIVPQVEEIPDWLRILKEEATQEEKVAAPEIPVEPVVQEPVAVEATPEKETITPVETPAPALGMDESEAAFAWLESLAVKQGAEEALLLKPEERLEAPPAWIQESLTTEAPVSAEAEKVFAVEVPLEQVAPPEIPFEAPILLEAEMAEMPPTLEFPSTQPEAEQVLEVLEPFGGIPVETAPEMPEWIKELESTEQISEVPLEAEITLMPETQVEAERISTIPEIPVESLLPSDQTAEALPELPSWLANELPQPPGIEGWTPPAPVIAEVSIHKVDLNQASLVELEKLPGVGFILAQSIINYRDRYGPFKNLEDLNNVPGFGQSTLDEIQGYLEVGYPPTHRILPVIEETDQAGLILGRNALVQGDISVAMEQYNALIKKHLFLPDVIRDLQDALYRFPVEPSVWQTLGDAYMRSDQLQDALDAYTKAEELLQ